MKIPFLNIEISSTRKVVPAEVVELKTAEIPPQQGLPVRGGQQSQPTHTLYDRILEAFGEVQSSFDLRFLEALEHLAMWNDDVSYALDNVVQLGSTRYNIYFDDSVTDEASTEMVKMLDAKSKNWYAGGMSSLINDLLTQCAISGALSAEAVPALNLKGIEKVVRVPVKSIRFRYNREKGEYLPYQLISGVAGEFPFGQIPLNTTTYKYYPLRRIQEAPYGIPPFLSALEAITIERDLVTNMAAVIKKFGVLGFLTALLKAPSKNTGETDIVYQNRVKTFLEEQAKELDKGMNKGYVVGVKDQHEFQLQSTVANAQGVAEIFKLNSERKMSGLKQDPLMLGRNYSTTETIGRVILTKLSSQVANYQKTVASFLSDLFFLELRLAGYAIKSVQVEFEAPTLTDALKDEQAYQAKIKNADELYKQGVISQEKRSQMLGYAKPDLPDPRFGMAGLPGDEDPDDPDGDQTGTDPGREPKTTENKKVTLHTINALAVSLGASELEFDYNACEECSGVCSHDGHHHHSFAWSFPDEGMDAMFQQYLTDTKQNYRKALDKVSRKIGRELAKFGAGASLQQVTDAVLFHLYKNWKADFNNPQKKVISKWVTYMYGEFRKDKSFFGKIDPKNIPDAVFGLNDVRTINYFKDSDELYMGRFVTDRDTRVRMTEWIKKEYIENGLPLGNNREALESFRKNFGDLFKNEEYKIVRIAATTTNKLRNYATINAFDSAEVERFVIRGVNDRLQCRYCASLQGKSFSVAVAKRKMERVIGSDPSMAPADSPFLSRVLRDYATSDIEAMSGRQLEQLGTDLVPAHPLCRDTLVADI